MISTTLIKRIGPTMTEAQSKRAEELADAFDHKITNESPDGYTDEFSFKAGYEAATQDAQVLVEALDKISIYPQGVPPEDPQPTEIEYAMAKLAEEALDKWRGE